MMVNCQAGGDVEALICVLFCCNLEQDSFTLYVHSASLSTLGGGGGGGGAEGLMGINRNSQRNLSQSSGSWGGGW